MAALRGGERMNFKTFVVRRKAEYSMRFPFLTERQILAKLRKVWESYKYTAASRGTKSDSAIQLPHAGRRSVPTPTSCQGRICSKGDLSTFDVPDFDLPVPVAPPLHTRHHRKNTTTHHTQSRYPSKKSSTTRQPSLSPEKSMPSHLTLEKSTAIPGKISPNIHPVQSLPSADSFSVASERSTGKAHSHTQPQQSQLSSPLTLSIPSPPPQRRLPLKPLDNNSNSSCCEKDSRNGAHRAHRETSPGTCSDLRKEADCCTTNTLPFLSQEAQQSYGMEESMTGPGKTLMTGLNAGVCSSRLWENEVDSLSPVTCVCDGHDTKQRALSSCWEIPHDTADSEESGTISRSREGVLEDSPKEVPLCESPVIQSLPSLEFATPNPDKFLEHSARLLPISPASSTDPISKYTVFEPKSMSSAESSIPGNVSNCRMHGISAVLPLSTETEGSSRCVINLISDSSLSGGPPAGDLAPVVNGRTHIQRRYCSRRKARAKSFWHLSYQSGELGQMNRTDSISREIVPSPLKDINSEKQMFSLSGDGVGSSDVTSNSTGVGNSLPFTSTSEFGGHQRECRVSSEQRVPSPSLSPASNPDDHQTSATTPPAIGDLMCDMFELLTPDHNGTEPHNYPDRNCNTSCTATTKRRVFRSVHTEEGSNFHSMFVNESDIFM